MCASSKTAILLAIVVRATIDPGATVLAQKADAPASAQSAEKPPRTADPLAEALLEAHNKVRAEEKRPPLKLNVRLNEAAQAHARDMAEHGKLTHDGTDGSAPPDRIKRTGYVYKECGENVADGQDDVGSAMRTWLKSPPHRKNILGHFTEMGGAMVKGADGTAYWCVDFGQPIARVNPATSPIAMIETLNRARSQAGKAALRKDDRLMRTAANFAREAARRKSLDVKGEGGNSPFDVLRKGNYPARRLAMTLSSGDGDPAKVVESWLEQETERQSLLSGFDRVGVGVASDAGGIPYWVVLLAQQSGR